MKKIAQKMMLEGVIRDANDVPYQAFVDGKILSVGSVLTVKEGPDKYELALIEIEEKEVLFTPVTGQYIRLRATSEVNGNPWTTVAEINVLGYQL